MKAVEEIKNDPDIPVWITGDSENPKSYWYLDRGVKIEWFPDGTVRIWNVMVSGYRYKEIVGIARDFFELYGWKAGLYRFNWEYFGELAQNTNSDEMRKDYSTKSEQYRKHFEKIIADYEF